MAIVPAGWFSSGCYRLLATESSSDHEKPARDVRRLLDCVRDEPPRRVWLSSFEIDRFEVTQGEYQQCLNSGACGRPPYPPTNWPKLDIGAALPAVVTFEDALSFCQWRGKRLPTSAEWQKAARGTDDRIYPWGDAPPTCNHVDEAKLQRDGFTLATCDPHSIHSGGVHQAGASPYGVHDLIDNVSEWVSDWSVEHAAEFAPGVSFSTDSIEEQVVQLREMLRAQGKHTDDKTLRETLENQPRPRTSSRMDHDRAVLEYDWTSVQFAWRDPSLVDPKGPSEPETSGVHQHVIKGGKSSEWGIPGDARSGDGMDDTHRHYAGIRCARSVAGPPAPDVKSPELGTFATPYREPGYVPPGTPASAERPPVPRKARTKL